MSYNNLSDNEKQNLLYRKYVDEGMSFAEIANEYNTYANKIRRDAIKYNVPIRDKSEAQKNVLNQGKSLHPTKGKKRTQEEKDKIGIGIYKAWNDLDEAERQKRKQKAKNLWENLSEDEKANRLHSAHLAIRQSSKHGSKLEKFLLAELTANGYKVEFHKEQVLSNTKLQIDLYLPKLTTAIEVDGPSHFAPVWGEDTLTKNKKYDQKKTGLILGKGMKLIRIVQKKDFSPTRAKLISERLYEILNAIENNHNDQKTFILEDE